MTKDTTKDSLVTTSARARWNACHAGQRGLAWDDLESEYRERLIREERPVVGAVLAALPSQVEALILTFDYDNTGYQKAIDDVLALLAVVENDQ